MKELETLEKVTEKIGTLNVYSGFDGVLKELVHITTEKKDGERPATYDSGQ